MKMKLSDESRGRKQYKNFRMSGSHRAGYRHPEEKTKCKTKQTKE
jgi:hypothetical protein